MLRTPIIISAAIAFALAGCTMGPDYKTPHVALDASFDAAPATRPSSTQPAAKPVDIARWWKSFNDPELDRLVDRAVASNLDVKIALMRLQESRASGYVISGGMLPYLEAGGAAARGSGSNSVKGRISPALNAATNTAGLREITQVVGFDAGWEIDLFGRYRRELEAAAADTQAAADLRDAVLVTLVSDVARQYVDMRTSQARLAITLQNISVAEKTLGFVQQRFDRGLTNELDLALARRQLATERATLAPRREAIEQSQRRLAVLLGRTPDALKPELQSPQEVPQPPEALITGVPVDLLRRRPDIRAAERQLAAENARIGVATADLFPRVAVTGGFGLQGQGLGREPKTDSFIWSAGPTAIVPLLDFGRIDSMIELENFRTKEQFYAYQRTVLNAIEEVDDAAGNYAAQQDHLYQLGQAVDASKRAVSLATGRYERGLIDFLNVLDAQRQLYELQDQYTVAQQAVVEQFIAVYKALGGGWQPYQAVPSIRRPMPAILAAGATVLVPPKSPFKDPPAARGNENHASAASPE